MMEHRRYERISSAVKLLVYRKGVPVAIGRIANVSRDGLFVKTEYSDVDRNQRVEVEFELPDSTSSMQRHRVAAWVVHKEERGLGLEVDDDVHYLQVLSSLIAALSDEPAEPERESSKRYYP